MMGFLEKCLRCVFVGFWIWFLFWLILSGFPILVSLFAE